MYMSEKYAKYLSKKLHTDDPEGVTLAHVTTVLKKSTKKFRNEIIVFNRIQDFGPINELVEYEAHAGVLIFFRDQSVVVIAEDKKQEGLHVSEIFLPKVHPLERMRLTNMLFRAIGMQEMIKPMMKHFSEAVAKIAADRSDIMH